MGFACFNRPCLVFFFLFICLQSTPTLGGLRSYRAVIDLVRRPRPVHITWADISVNGRTQDRSGVIVVDKRGPIHSVQQAVDMVPKGNTHRYKILINPGEYWEKVTVPNDKPFISFIGNSLYKASYPSIICSDKANNTGIHGKRLGTFRAACVIVEADYFAATRIIFRNTVISNPGEEGNQAPALRISGNYAFFFEAAFKGSQDTLYDASGKHYYYGCDIEGRVDFICGDGQSIFRNCYIKSLAPSHGAIAAQKRDDPRKNTGFSFVNCKINGTGQVYLGRAWGKYSRIIYSGCEINVQLKQERWSYMGFPEYQKTVEFREYGNRENGIMQAWANNRITNQQKAYYQSMNFIDGESWLRLENIRRRRGSPGRGVSTPRRPIRFRARGKRPTRFHARGKGISSIPRRPIRFRARGKAINLV